MRTLSLLAIQGKIINFEGSTPLAIVKTTDRRSPLGFYRAPFYRDDGAMFLAYDYLLHPYSLHYQDVMLLNKDWYSHTPTPDGQIYFVPAKNIPEQKFDLKFGHILLQDSVKDCYEFYHEILEITPNIDGPANREL